MIGKEITGIKDHLPNYTISDRLIDGIYLTVKKSENSIVRGYGLLVSNKDLSLIDTYEGNKYFRIRVTLASGYEAWVYIAKEEIINI